MLLYFQLEHLKETTMLIGAEAKKEKLVSLRIEYDALFRHFHFMQVLRFGIIGAMLPILAALFNYYRAALPFTQFRALRDGVSINSIEPVTAILVAFVGLGALFAAHSIERGIGIQTRAIVERGSVIETQLGIARGAFATLLGRVNTRAIHRISGIIIPGYFIGGVISIILVAIGLWALGK